MATTTGNSILSVLFKRVVRFALRTIFLQVRRFGIIPPEQIFRHLYKAGPFVIVLPNGFHLRLMAWGDRVENEFFWRGWRGHEPEVMRWWVKFAGDGGDILDIGANTGTFAFIAKGTSPRSSVHAFEPLLRIANRIEENGIVSGMDVVVVNTAVADTEGECEIFDPGGDNAYSASLDSEFLQGKKNSYPVSVTTIDEYCAQQQLSPTLIKIDVEGAEGRVIVGARRTLEKGHCRIICEWLGQPQQNEEACAILTQYGYVALDPTNFQPVDLNKLREFEDRNVLLIHASEIPLLCSAQ
tara:strand:+ start:150 stop:1040 length:891 start_codon:yes stop_codon:yes gene_type:complete